MVRQEAAQRKSSAVSVCAAARGCRAHVRRAGLLAGATRSGQTRAQSIVPPRRTPVTGPSRGRLQAYCRAPRGAPLDSAGPGRARILPGDCPPGPPPAPGPPPPRRLAAGAASRRRRRGSAPSRRLAIVALLGPLPPAGRRRRPERCTSLRRPSAASRARRAAARCPPGCAARGSRSARARRRSRRAPARGPARLPLRALPGSASLRRPRFSIEIAAWAITSVVVMRLSSSS